jgi:aerobic C4-dicarboxylate transport protein
MPTMPTPSAKLNGAEASPAPAGPRSRARDWYKHLSVQILLAMLSGVFVGHEWPQRADSLKPLGDLFIKLVRMLVAPIIF